MPAYTYRCPRCGNVEERIVSLDERDNQVCLNLLQGGGTGEDPPFACCDRLVRDEIELTARTPGRWRP